MKVAFAVKKQMSHAKPTFYIDRIPYLEIPSIFAIFQAIALTSHDVVGHHKMSLLKTLDSDIPRFYPFLLTRSAHVNKRIWYHGTHGPS